MIRLSIRQQKSYHYRSAAQRIGNIRAGWTQAGRASGTARQCTEAMQTQQNAAVFATPTLIAKSGQFTMGPI